MPITYYNFPAPHLLPSATDPKFEPLLRELGFGYRAGFITSTLDTLRQEFGSEPGEIEAVLESWRAMSANEARDKFVNLKGVGRKVADCVMLMSCDKVGH
jgi:N-glycosylase/DNA lyase